MAKFTLRSFLSVLSTNCKKRNSSHPQKKASKEEHSREERQKELFLTREVYPRERINQSEKCEENIMKLKSNKVFVGGKLKRNVLNSF